MDRVRREASQNPFTSFGGCCATCGPIACGWRLASWLWRWSAGRGPDRADDHAAVDRVLNPAQLGFAPASCSRCRSTATSIYLNSFVPRSIHYVGTVFAIALVFLFVVKAVAEYLGNVADPIRRPRRDHRSAQSDVRKVGAPAHRLLPAQTTGRLMSAVINDVERARSTLSENLASFSSTLFTFVFLVAGSAG